MGVGIDRNCFNDNKIKAMNKFFNTDDQNILQQ